MHTVKKDRTVAIDLPGPDRLNARITRCATRIALPAALLALAAVATATSDSTRSDNLPWQYSKSDQPDSIDGFSYPGDDSSTVTVHALQLVSDS